MTSAASGVLVGGREPGEMIDRAEAKGDLRQTFLEIFPDGIQFVPARVGDRQLWTIVGGIPTGQLGTGPEDPWFSMNGDPNGAPSILNRNTSMEFVPAASPERCRECAIPTEQSDSGVIQFAATRAQPQVANRVTASPRPEVQ